MPNGAQPVDPRLVERLAQIVAERLDPAISTNASGELVDFLRMLETPAPRPVGPDGRPTFRWQDAFIEDHVPVGASVVDLGCGGGQLLATLRDRKRVRAQGIELNPESVAQCIERGVPVIQADLDEGLDGFADDSFDYAILEETLQTLHRPMAVLEGMLRVARRSVVSFPNFAHWRVRMDLTVRGRMPVTAWLPNTWYDTPNIHLLTIQDFFDMANECGIEIYETAVLSEGTVRPFRDDDNLNAEEAILVFGRNGHELAEPER